MHFFDARRSSLTARSYPYSARSHPVHFTFTLSSTLRGNYLCKVILGLFCLEVLYQYSVFRVRIGFNADPDPAFYLNADPALDPGSQTIHVYPDTGQTFPTSQKVGFCLEKYTLCM
jgi:hypothetical protein